jgi:hypothetical protein
VNCRVGIGGSSCLGGDVGGIRVGVKDRLATGDRIVLGAGVIFLFSHKEVELLLSSPSVPVFIKDISGALPLYLASESCSSFFSSTSGLGGYSSIGTAGVDTIVFRIAVFLLLSPSAVRFGCTA